MIWQVSWVLILDGENRLVELRRAELLEVAPTSVADDVRCRLTLKGTKVTDSLQRSELTEITVPDVVFHGFMRCPILVDKRSFFGLAT